jgi:hypothetical protein
MTAFVLELTAMATMLLDHIQVVFNIDPALRLIGRIAFPLYAFLIVNGYEHVRRREGGLRKYLLRLLILALVSEIPYDLMSEGTMFDWESQNQVLQFFIAMAALASTGWLKDHIKAGDNQVAAGNASGSVGNALVATGRASVSAGCASGSVGNASVAVGGVSLSAGSVLSGALCAVIWAAAIAVCHRFHIGYSGSGILLIIIYKIYFDKFYDRNYAERLAYLVLMTLVFVAFEWVEVHLRAGIGVEKFISDIGWYFRWYKRNTWAAFGMPFAAAYRGDMGYNGKGFRIAYRFFYPVHQIALWGLSVILLAA